MNGSKHNGHVVIPTCYCVLDKVVSSRYNCFIFEIYKKIYILPSSSICNRTLNLLLVWYFHMDSLKETGKHKQTSGKLASDQHLRLRELIKGCGLPLHSSGGTTWTTNQSTYLQHTPLFPLTLYYSSLFFRVYTYNTRLQFFWLIEFALISHFLIRVRFPFVLNEWATNWTNAELVEQN